jgi:hypothetical protein
MYNKRVAPGDTGAFFFTEERRFAMKKTMLILMCVTMLVNVHGQGNSVWEINGHEWLTYHSGQQTAIMVGYMLAMNAVVVFSADTRARLNKMAHTEANKTTMLTLAAYESWAMYENTDTLKMAQRVTKYYNDNPKDRNATIGYLIPMLYDKKWW